MELRTKLDELNSKILKYESNIREQKEEFYLINTENTNLKSDIKNLTNMERALRADVSNLMQQRQELENTLQRVKSKISQDSFQIRKYETENEALNRQVMSMENTITIASKEAEDMKERKFTLFIILVLTSIRNENIQLKEALNNKDKEIIMFRKTLERKESELQSSKASLSRANSLLEAHQSSNEYYETVERRNDEYSAPRPTSHYTPDYSPFNKKAAVPNSLASILNPYDSPITSYKRQGAPVVNQGIYSAQSMTPRTPTSSLPKPITPVREQARKSQGMNFTTASYSPENQSKFCCVMFQVLNSCKPNLSQ